MQASKPRSQKQDWICPICHNHNYSFRTRCNRCQNGMTHWTQTLDRALHLPLAGPRCCSPADELKRVHPGQHSSRGQFPNAVFLGLGEEVWAEDLKASIEMRECLDLAEVEWINRIIE